MSLVIQLNVSKHLIHKGTDTKQAGHQMNSHFRGSYVWTPSPERDRDRSGVCLSNLHPNDGIDEEEHGDEQADVWQSLEGLDEGPQENSDGVTLSQKFDETSCSEELQEAHVERINKLGEGRENRCLLMVLNTGIQYWCSHLYWNGAENKEELISQRYTRSLSTLHYSYHLQVYHDLCDAAQNSDEVKNVPRVSKVVLRKQERRFQ